MMMMMMTMMVYDDDDDDDLASMETMMRTMKQYYHAFNDFDYNLLLNIDQFNWESNADDNLAI